VKKNWRRNPATFLAAALVASSVLFAVPLTASASSKVTLTLWENYGTESNAVATRALAKAFTKENPNIAINVVSEPADNYFPLLQSADVAKNGPDLAVMWTGLYALQYEGMIQPLKGHVPAADLAKMEGLSWMSPGMNTPSNPLVIPLETQFYIGFYNKSLFAKAGVTSVPTDWSQLYSACTKLKKIGVIPFAYGNGGQALGAEFYPWYDMSYMMIGDYSVAQWKNLYNGTIPWTSKTTQASLAAWQKLETMGCTNPDVLTDTTNIQQFETGKAAMIMDGTWDTAEYTTAMGAKVAAFVPPFSAKPIKGVVDFPGDGISVMNYSKHLSDDYKFETFLTTPAAAAIINKAGLIPDLEGTTTTNAVNQQMLNFVTNEHLAVYPMLDNVTQGNVVNAGSSELTTVLANQTKPNAALAKMQQVWQQLPANQRGKAYAG
jgi:ABC-type glycerol-3-phosphate transport system substrate-binding protein